MSTDVAIKIENLGKRYRYGSVAPINTNLRADLTEWVKGWVNGRGSRVQSQPSSLNPRHSTLREVHEKHIAEDPNYFWALRDINLEIKQGEVVGIIGRNGAGKSTLLKILSRITPPTTGKITYNGRMASLLEVGTGFHRELTGRENIYLNGSILGMRRNEITKKFDEIVAFAEVEKFIDTPVKFYSSGMYVRLAFAVAAHLEPEILVVDEVLAVGDAEFQKKCLGKMQDISKREGRTVLFVSHNMMAVRTLCNNAIFLDRGSAAWRGPAADCVNYYLTKVQQQTAESPHETLVQGAGNSSVKLGTVRILADGVEVKNPSVDKPITVEVEYNNLKQGKRNVSIHLANSAGQLLFTSGNIRSAALDPDSVAESPLEPGIYTTRCTIPGYFFNPGLHSMRVFIYAGMPPHVFVEFTREFEVLETDRFREEYFGEWLGAVRPLLAWKTEKKN